MGLFFDVLSAINNPNQQASVDQLSTITNTVQQLANSHGVEPSTMQTILSGLGGALRPALQQQASSGGLGELVGQLAGAGAGTAGLGGLSSFLTPELQQQLIQGITQRTGISAGVIQSLLPSLVPIVLQLLSMGSSKTGGGLAGLASNPLLKSFLDSDRDQDVDLGDVFKFANRFINPPR
jgi:hypothetical protein